MNVKIFNHFVDFVTDLHNVFGNRMKSISMYHVLVTSLQKKHQENETDIKYIEQIDKHVEVLSEFLKSNSDSIFNQKSDLIVQKNITYSERIFIDFELVLRHSEEKDAIWKHLLVLSTLCDPQGKAKNALDKFLEEDTPENNMIKNIAAKLEEHKFADTIAQSGASNPMDMMGMLGSSGIMSSLMSSMDPASMNNIDPKKLIKTMRNMLDTISKQIENEQ
jgi:hypothetical protein